MSHGQEKVYEAKLKGKKVTLQLGGMGLQVFGKGGKALETHLYQSMLSWNELPQGFEIMPKGMTGGQSVVFACDDGQEIVLAMQQKAVEMIKALKAAGVDLRSPRRDASAAGTGGPAGGEAEAEDEDEPVAGAEPPAPASTRALLSPGMPEQKLYCAMHAGEAVQLEVSGMGLRVYDQSGSVLETHMYERMVSWGVEVAGKGFEVEVNDGAAGSTSAVAIFFACGNGAEICGAITEKAVELSTAKRSLKAARQASMDRRVGEDNDRFFDRAPSPPSMPETALSGGGNGDGEAALPVPALPAAVVESMVPAKLKGKAVQLVVGGMGLQVEDAPYSLPPTAHATAFRHDASRLSLIPLVAVLLPDRSLRCCRSLKVFDKSGKAIETFMYEAMASWELVPTGFQMAPRGKKPKALFACR